MALTPRDVLAKNREDAAKISTGAGAKKLDKALKDAHGELVAKLAKAKPGTFGETQMKATLAQIRDVMDQHVLPGIQDATVLASETAADYAAGGVIEYLERAELEFAGTGMTPLALREAAVLDAATQGASASVLRRLSTGQGLPNAMGGAGGRAAQGILARYGENTIGVFEETLQRGLIARKSMIDMRTDLIAESPFLQGAPVSFAQRIVRTECLTGDVTVSGAMVGAIHRRWFEGDVFEIVTERGRKFTTTANHPMLSRMGWISTSKLQVGDNLIGYNRKQNARSFGDKNVATPPTKICEIFDALSLVGVRERRQTIQEDFHGDGCDGYVDVLSPRGGLQIGSFASIRKPISDRVFSPTNTSNAEFCSCCQELLPVGQSVCLCTRTNTNTSRNQVIFNRLLSSLKGSREALQALVGFVPQPKFGFWKSVGPQMVSRSTASPFRFRSSHTGTSDDSSNHSNSCSQPSGYFEGAEATDIEFDRVRSIRIRKFAGHVFNLTTPHGYFAIDGLYTGNTMGAYARASIVSMGEVNEELGDMIKILSAIFDARTGSDSYSTHGQMRRMNEPFDTWYGPIMAPPDRPNDRSIVVPHRLSWGRPPAYLTPRTIDQVQERWEKYERRKDPMEEIPLISTIDDAEFGAPAGDV